MTATSSLPWFTRSIASETLLQTSTDNASSCIASAICRVATASSETMRAVPMALAVGLSVIRLLRLRGLAPVRLVIFFFCLGSVVRRCFQQSFEFANLASLKKHVVLNDTATTEIEDTQ